jgi:hypothetical protein
LAVFFAFFGAGVAGEEAALLEFGAEVWIVLEECAGDAVAGGASLTGLAAAEDIDNNVELGFKFGEDEGLFEDHAEGGAIEVFFDVFAVDSDGAGAWAEIDAGDGGLATASADVLDEVSGWHRGLLGRGERLQREGEGVLASVGVLVTAVHFEFFDHVAAQSVFGEHALDGGEEDVLGLCGHDLGSGALAHAAWIA